MSFIDSPRFPTDVSFNSLHRPRYNNSRIVVRNGRIKTNINWPEPLHTYDLGYGVRTQEQLYNVMEFFHATKAAHGFRLKDWNDWKSPNEAPRDAAISPTDQLLGTGDGIKTRFLLVKSYPKGSLQTNRTIAKPVVATIRAAVNDVETVDFSFDAATWEIVLDNPAPSGETVKAGYEFDVPVQLSEDEIEISYQAWKAGSLRIPVHELRPEDAI